MSKEKTNIASKILAWFFLFAFAFVFFLSIAGVGVLARTGAYWDGGHNFREAMAEEVFSFDRQRIRYVLNEYKRQSAPNDAHYRQIYDPANSNVFFYIKDSKGAVVVDYGSDAEYQISYEYEEFYTDTGRAITEKKYFFSREEARDYVEELESEYYVSSWTYSHESGELEVSFFDYEVYVVEAYIRRDLSARDIYFYSLRAADLIVAMRYWMILIGAISVIVCLLIVIYLCTAEARAAGKEGYSFNFIHRVPLDAYISLCVLCCTCMVQVFNDFTTGDEFDWLSIFLFVCVFTLCLAMIASAAVTFAVRLKKANWWKNNLIYYFISFAIKMLALLFKTVRYVFKNIPLFWKALLFILLLKAIEFLFMALEWEVYTAFWILEGAALIFAVIYMAIVLQKLHKASTEISNGDLDYRADLSYTFGLIKEHGENLNNIGAGLKTALGEQIKSEHMKAELITNVSHDIKTPLTSIVNYVSLLKKEGLSSESAFEYLDVLERQSAKLKKLTEDLIDASKATTGCVKVNAENTDINVLLSQASGEYEGKFMEKELYPVLTLAEENPTVYADGGLLWRVFDNLLNNICKYSQRGTRVYLKSNVSNGKVTVSFSNISEAQLNISSEELMERFVRGDESRNTEGSGLGLSIARSLIELQNGKFDISIDGDLFKAEIEFDTVSARE